MKKTRLINSKKAEGITELWATIVRYLTVAAIFLVVLLIVYGMIKLFFK